MRCPKCNQHVTDLTYHLKYKCTKRRVSTSNNSDGDWNIASHHDSDYGGFSSEDSHPSSNDDSFGGGDFGGGGSESSD